MTAFSARIWLEVPADSAPLKITSPDGTISPGNWLATQAEKARLSDVIIPITTDDWKRATINFTSETDTLVTLSLLGPWNEKSAPEYVLYDQLSLTGATLANLSFEEKEGPGFRSWQSPEIPFGQWLIVNEVALDGDNIAPAWNNTPIAQSIAVKAGVPVLLTLFAKAASPPGSEKLFPLGQKTPAHAAAREIQRGINFGNPWEVAPPFSWQIEYSPQDVDHAAAEGFDHLRLPISWQHYLIRKNGRSEISPKLLTEIDPIINRALEKKMHVIIDWHHFDDFTSAPMPFNSNLLMAGKRAAGPSTWVNSAPALSLIPQAVPATPMRSGLLPKSATSSGLSGTGKPTLPTGTKNPKSLCSKRRFLESEICCCSNLLPFGVNKILSLNSSNGIRVFGIAGLALGGRII